MIRYALRRGRQWITAPNGDGDPIPPVIAFDDSPTQAWCADTIDQAIERQKLLRICWGWATEIRALHQ